MLGVSLLLFQVQGLAGVPPTFAVGDRAKEDIVTPVPLIVIDPARTDKMRTQEAQRIGAIMRFRTEAAAEAELQLHVAIAVNRERFLELLQTTYHRMRLENGELTLPRFQRLASSFQRAARPFPFNTNLAQAWAQGQNADEVEGEWGCKLREAMGQYLCPDQLPPEGRIGPAQWRLISSAEKEPSPELRTILRMTTPVHRTNVMMLTRARKNLIASFPIEEQAAGKFVAGFMRENCVIDIEMTRSLRASKTNSLWAVDHYAAGETIVKAGDVIDLRAKAALDKLDEKRAMDREQLYLVHALGKAQADMSSLKHETESARRRAWLMSVAAIGVAATGLVIWRLRPQRSTIPLLLPERSGDVSAGLLATSEDLALPVVANSWRVRAVTAERRVQKLTHALQIRLAPHLARWLAHKWVQQVISNRKQLLEVQRQAEAEIAALETRLAEMQAPLQERLRAYENRIIELEEQLLLKDQQNRELIEMTIATARLKLEKELAASMEWN
jgi:hypothetical protein